MKRKLATCLAFYLTLLGALKSSAQAPPQSDTIQIAQASIQHFEYAGDTLYTLDSLGQLAAFHLKTRETIPLKVTLDSVRILTKSLEGRIHILTKDGNLRKILSPSVMPVVYRALPSEITSWGKLLVISDSKIYASITGKGLYSLRRKRYFYPTGPFPKPKGERYYGEIYLSDNIFLIDENSKKIYIGFDFGEWGGGIISFDYSTERFSTAPLDGNQYKSITISKHGKIFGFSSLTHLGSFTRSISLFDNYSDSVANILDSRCNSVREDTSTGKTLYNPHCFFPEVGLYWGPAEFKPGTDSLLFYSEKGFLYGQFPSADGHIFSDLKPLVNPQLAWYYGMRNAAGIAMNIRRVAWLPQPGIAFLFQTTDGIGYYHDGRLTFLR